jgi:hypothetical protein
MPAQPDLDRRAKAEAASEIPRDAVLAALNQVVSSEVFGKTERPAPSEFCYLSAIRYAQLRNKYTPN